MLAARKFRRGPLRLLEDLRPFQRLGLATAPLSIVLNRADTVSIDAMFTELGNIRLTQSYHSFERSPNEV